MTNLIYRGYKQAANDNAPRVDKSKLVYRGANNQKDVKKDAKRDSHARLVYRGAAA